MTRHIKRGGRIWIRVFPDKPITQKPAEVRMGNGKGNVEFWVSEINQEKYYMKWMVFMSPWLVKLSV